jgi:hypothetical protein
MQQDILRHLGSRYIPIIPKRLATSRYSGEWPSPYKGKGLEFMSHRPYQLGDDFRSIHMATTVRTGKKMVVERIVRRDISILVVLDCSASMGVRWKADMLFAASLMLLFSGISLEMRTGVALVGDNGYYRLGMGMGRRHALRLSNIIEEVYLSLKQGRQVSLDFPKMDIHRILPVGGILLYLSDFLDQRGFIRTYTSFSLDAKRYDFVPVVIQDEFEFSFPQTVENTVVSFSDPETGSVSPVWLGTSEKALIKTSNEKRFSELCAEFSRNGLGFTHIKNPNIEQIHKILTQFFVARS